MKNTPKTGTFADLVGKGENPYGFTVCTPNGVERDGQGADGYSPIFGPSVSGPRWNNVPKDDGMMVVTFQARSNIPKQFSGATLPRKARGVKKD